MKIAMIAVYASPLAAPGGEETGGQNVHVGALSAALVRRGHDVTVYTRRVDPGAPEEIRTTDGYRLVLVPAGPARPVAKDALLSCLPPFARRLAARWRTDPPDLVHAHYWISGLTASLAASGTDLPFVETFHALGVVKRRHLGAADLSPAGRVRIERALGERADRVIATSQAQERELAGLGVPSEHVRVVTGGVDTRLFRPGTPTGGDRPRIVAAARLVPHKGLGTAVSALADVPDAELVVAGGPDDLAGAAEAHRLRRLAAETGVADRVVFRGRVPHEEMPALLRGADVFVAAPWYEPVGMAALEAMACGVPVVASDAGGLAEIVGDDGLAGRLVTPRDPRGVAAAIRTVLDAPGARDAMGEAARRRALTYSWEHVAEKVDGVYAELRPSPPADAPVPGGRDGGR